MDRLDIQILRRLVEGSFNAPLQSDIRKSYREIAREVHVDEETVRARIGKIKQSGFIHGWNLAVNPHLLDVKMTTVTFDSPSPASKGDLIRKLKLIHGALTIVNHYGRSMAVILFYESEDSLKKEVELISRLSNTENLIRTELPFPECSVSLSRTDWSIIRLLQSDPRRRYARVAKELGLSPRTVKRRLTRMIKGNALFAIPSVDLRALKGAIVADLSVFYSGIQYKNKLDENIISHLDYCLMRAEKGDREHALFNLILLNIAEADEIVGWVREQHGAARADLELVQDRIELYDSFREVLNRKMEQVLAAN